MSNCIKSIKKYKMLPFYFIFFFFEMFSTKVFYSKKGDKSKNVMRVKKLMIYACGYNKLKLF